MLTRDFQDILEPNPTISTLLSFICLQLYNDIIMIGFQSNSQTSDIISSVLLECFRSNTCPQEYPHLKSIIMEKICLIGDESSLPEVRT